MTDVYKYRVWCEEDSKWEYVWREADESPPSVCPTNSAHSVDESKTTIHETVIENQVIIKDEQVSTGGNYQACGFRHTIDHVQDTWKDFDETFPFDINFFAISWISNTQSKYDELQFLVGPDSSTGNITVDVAVDDTIVSVDQATIDGFEIGYIFILDDGTTTESLGRVISIDRDENKITTESAATNTFSTATPTSVKRTIELIRGACLTDSGRTHLGSSTAGASFIPANTVLRIRYKNVEGTTSGKYFPVMLEYKY